MGKKKSDARWLREKEQRKIKRQKQLEEAMKNSHYRAIKKSKNYVNTFMRVKNRCHIMVGKKGIQICDPCFQDCIVVPVKGNMVAHCENPRCGIQLCKKCYTSKLCGFCKQGGTMQACAKGHD